MLVVVAGFGGLVIVVVFTSLVLRAVLLVNKQGQTRLSQYYVHLPLDERVANEGEIIRKCLGRSERQCT